MTKSTQPQSTTYTRKEVIRQPLPNRVVRLLSEARWIALAVVFLYFVMILLSYNKGDPGWSHEVEVAKVTNLGGRAGAYLADWLLFMFGFSAWWWCVCFLRLVWKGYRSLTEKFVLASEAEPEHEQEATIRWIGFTVMFIGSVGLEFLRMWSLQVQLPRMPGGVLGKIIGSNAHTVFGFNGATLLLLLLFGVGFSLFFHVSWMAVAERIGAAVESGIDYFRRPPPRRSCCCETR